MQTQKRSLGSQALKINNEEKNLIKDISYTSGRDFTNLGQLLITNKIKQQQPPLGGNKSQSTVAVIYY